MGPQTQVCLHMSVLLGCSLLLYSFDFDTTCASTLLHLLSPCLSVCYILVCPIALLLSSPVSLPSLFLSRPRVTLDPSKRPSTNKSMSGCTLPQGTKPVSKFSFPMFSGCFCLSVCLQFHGSTHGCMLLALFNAQCSHSLCFVDLLTHFLLHTSQHCTKLKQYAC